MIRANFEDHIEAEVKLQDKLDEIWDSNQPQEMPRSPALDELTGTDARQRSDKRC